ncbi:class I adenylate-forming enzyme family protein [Nocardia transvalensis]|uniref:class I adenylate-forming enzyme family protein n=1 Tax=Nocardia transvalensis TaxID=37333 RepID=UPI001894A7D8|nr:AMP-binding protein [Nocardia transvalensis]MBF6327714.1 AMP-binding protein [Nocardia transvalensis]
MAGRVSICELVAKTAADRPRDCAVKVRGFTAATSDEITWNDLVTRAHARAEAYRQGGLRAGDVAAVALPPGIGHVVATLALWEAGAVVVPVDHRWSEAAKSDVVDRYPRGWVVEGADRGLVSCHRREDPVPGLAELLADAMPRSVSLSGGTTGVPKLVVRNRPWAYDTSGPLSGLERERGMTYGQTQIVGLPLYHAGFGALYHGLALGHRIVIPGNASPKLFLELLRSEQVEVLRTVPAQMGTLLQACGMDSRWFSSLRLVVHTAAGCPDAVKRRWLELVEPTRVYEEYGSVERIGVLSIRGDEWLRHPGSVGRPAHCSVRILDDFGEEVAAGSTGELFMTDENARQPLYIGSGPKLAEADGHYSVGDLAYMDADGYVTLVGRKDDAINVGGVKVFPRDIERVLERHAAVRDIRIRPMPDPRLGQVVHAEVSLHRGDEAQILAELWRSCRAELTRAQTPRVIEIVDDVHRTAAGKLRRWD